MNNDEKILDKYKGCLYGGAIGDALGYPIELRSAVDIFTIYGENGMQYYDLFHGKALISDDTQMTLFTATGLLEGYTRLCLRGIMGKWQSYVELAYKDWLITQNETCETANMYCKSWLLNVKEMYSCRSPGNTCLSALMAKKCGSVSEPINDSKGCGGVMRVAAVGLYLPKHSINIAEADQIGAEIVAITHGHPLGYIAAAALAIAVYCTLKYPNDFVKAVTASVNHDGDSDSTGAVTGNIIGAYLGRQRIPDEFIEPLEIKEVISEIAVDLFEDCKMSEYGNCYDV